jgi:hypothetical protein
MGDPAFDLSESNIFLAHLTKEPEYNTNSLLRDPEVKVVAWTREPWGRSTVQIRPNAP